MPKLKIKKIVGTTVNLQPLYSINWTNDWPCIVNSNLLRIKKFDYKTAINKKIKLQINHTLSTENRSKSLEPSTSSHKAGSPVITKDIYNQGALNIDLLGICPSLHSCAQFTKSLSKDTDHKEPLDSCSLILESDPSESPGSQRIGQMFKEGENLQASNSQLPEPLTSHLNPPSENIIINKCGTCNKQLNKCVCKLRCTACFNLQCTCSKYAMRAINT